MYTPDALMTSIFTRPVKGGGGDGEDVGGFLPPLASKLVLTMQPPLKKFQDVDIDTPLLKLTFKLVLNLDLKGSTSSFSSSMQQQQEKTTTASSANRSRNEALINFELKLDDNIPPPPPIVALGKINVVIVVANCGAIDSPG